MTVEEDVEAAGFADADEALATLEKAAMPFDEFADLYGWEVGGIEPAARSWNQTLGGAVLTEHEQERADELHARFATLDLEIEEAFEGGDLDRADELDAEYETALQEMFELMQAFEEGGEELELSEEETYRMSPEQERILEAARLRGIQSPLEHVRVAHQLEQLKASRLSPETREQLYPGFQMPNEDLHPIIADTAELIRDGVEPSRAMAIPLRAGLPLPLAYRVTREAERIAAE